jgi:hypothetical protein
VRRSLLIVLLAGVVLPSGLAAAAPKGAEASTAPPYSDSFAFQRATCAAGATCTGTSSAADSGQVLAGSDYSRETTAFGQESQLSWGGFRFRHRTAPGATTMAVTFTWLVSAAATADGRSGDVFGEAWISSFGSGCGKDCTVTEDRYVVVDAVDRAGVPFLGGDDDHPAGFPTEVRDQLVTVTLTYAGRLPTWVSGGSLAVAATAGYPMAACPVDGFPPCGVDSGHAGSAHTALDARLQSIAFDDGSEEQSAVTVHHS